MKEARRSRVVIIGLALIAIAIVVIVWSMARGGEGSAATSNGAARDRGSGEATRSTGRGVGPASLPGTLRLEGQVVDASERPVGDIAARVQRACADDQDERAIGRRERRRVETRGEVRGRRMIAAAGLCAHDGDPQRDVVGCGGERIEQRGHRRLVHHARCIVLLII